MAFAHVQSTTVSADTSPAVSAAFGSNTAVGNLIVVTVVGDGGSTPTLTSITDSKGNTYTLVPGSSFGNGLNMVAYYTVVATGGAAHTVTATWNDALENVRVVAKEFSGFTGTPTVDQVKTASGSSITPASGSTGTTVRENELVIGMLARAGTTASVVTAGSGFSDLTTTATTVAAAMESRVVSSAGGQNATFNLSVSRAWLAACVTFYDSADVGGGPTGPTGGSFFATF